MLCILKAGFAWLALWLIGVNLFGMVLRGLVQSPVKVDAPSDRVRAEIDRANRGGFAVTVLCILLAAAYMFALYYYWNALLLCAGVALMLSRFPDQLWEARTGKRATGRSGPKSRLWDVLSNLLWFGALPLIWYAICRNAK